jgi:cell wall-associated NlpC family hydrolase
VDASDEVTLDDIDIEEALASNSTIDSEDLDDDDTDDSALRLRSTAATTKKKKKTKGDLIVAAARKGRGTKYVWAGGNCKGPTGGGFGCSGMLNICLRVDCNSQ